MVVTRTWDGDDWQAYVTDLLRIHYGPGEFVEVPDTDRGDAGLDGYSQDGVAYQCYAPEEPLSVEARYTKHRDKMSDDLRKLRQNKDGKVRAVLGETKVRRWVLVVPEHDSRRLVEHANKKTKEIREAELPYVADDFTAVVITDEHFPVERAKLFAQTFHGLDLGLLDPGADEVQRYAEATGPDLARADLKLAKLSALADGERRAEYRNSLLTQHLLGMDALDRLRTDYPDLAADVEKGIAEYKRRLLLEQQGTGDGVARIIADDLEKVIRERLTTLRPEQARAMAWAQVMEWLMQCPLDFVATA